MKFVLAAAVVALTSLALPVAAKPCDENATEAMKRPGGYCDILQSNQSLSTPADHTATANGGKTSGGDWQLPDGAQVPKT
jgi:hypothetical protein